MKLEILDIIEPDEVEWLKQDMLRRIDPEGVDRPYDWIHAQNLWQLSGMSGMNAIDRRVVLKPGDPAYNLVQHILYRHFQSEQWFYIAYQRQLIPHTPHVDLDDSENGAYDGKGGYSLIIPLMEAPEFKLLLWNKILRGPKDVADLKNELRLHPENFSIKQNTSQEYQVNHCNWKMPLPLTDVLELIGVYDYKIGTVGKFPRNYLHASNDWLSCGKYPYKDFIIVHSTLPNNQ